MPADARPIFVDPSGRRRRRVLRVAMALGVLSALIAGLFTLSLLRMASLPRVPGLTTAEHRAVPSPLPSPPRRAKERDRFLEVQARRQLLSEIAQENRKLSVQNGALDRGNGETEAPPIVGAFYAGWQETGDHSLSDHADHLTHLFPVWLRLGLGSEVLDLRDWDPGLSPRNVHVLRICRDHGISIHPVLANAHEGSFDRQLAHVLLSDPAR